VNADSRVAQILKDAEVWDMTLPWLERYWEIDILRRYQRAGFHFVSATIEDLQHTFEGTMSCIARFKQVMAEHSDWLAFGQSIEDIEQGRREGKLVLGVNLQNTIQLDMDLARVAAFRAAGVRHMLLAYQTRNYVADGCAETSDAGLSNFGRQVVREMDRVGIVLDCSHTGRRSSLEAMELTEHAPIFSHSNAHAVCPHIRNITDEQIRACAARNGVIGVVGVGAFLGDAEARARTMFRHIDYISSLVGPQHVGLGTDYVKDLAPIWGRVKMQKEVAWPDPTGTQLYEGVSFRPEQLGDLVQEMLAHGYSTEVMRGILGGNFKRIYAGQQ
jgi:membrane dipeptidase